MTKKLLLTLGVLALLAPVASMQAQRYGYPPPGYRMMPPRPQSFPLGTAHVDGFHDHDNIQVGRFAGRFHAILLGINDAPIEFEQVVIHYEDGFSQPLPVQSAIGPGGYSRWIVLPGGRRAIHSLELWYSRANPGDPIKPEVVLYGAP